MINLQNQKKVNFRQAVQFISVFSSCRVFACGACDEVKYEDFLGPKSNARPHYSLNPAQRTTIYLKFKLTNTSMVDKRVAKCLHGSTLTCYPASR